MPRTQNVYRVLKQKRMPKKQIKQTKWEKDRKKEGEERRKHHSENK